MDIQRESENFITDDNSSCISVSNHYLQVNLPIEIGAYAELECAKVTSCSKPIVEMQQTCESGCEYELVVTQEVKIKIPIKYGANVKVSNIQVDYKSKNTN